MSDFKYKVLWASDRHFYSLKVAETRSKQRFLINQAWIEWEKVWVLISDKQKKKRVEIMSKSLPSNLNDSKEKSDVISMLQTLLETLRNNEKPMADLRNQLG